MAIEETEILSLRITPTLKVQLRKLAKKEVRNLTDQVRKILTEAVK